MKKKSQMAMEFLMTYGWAILVVLIAIGALAYFGVINPNKFIEKCSCSYEGMRDVDRFDYEGLDWVICYNKENKTIDYFNCENRTLVPAGRKKSE